MNKIIKTKKKTKLSGRKKAVDMTTYAGKVKSFKQVDANAYQQKIRK